MMDQIFVKKEV